MASVQETRWDWKIFGNLGWWGGERPHTNSVVGFNAQLFTIKKKYNWFTVLCFRCAVKWFSYTHIHILFQILFHYRLLQDTERRYLCRRALLLTISYVCVLVTQACLTLCDSMDCSPPGSSIHGILQARILEWVAIPFSRGSSPPRDWTLVSSTAGGFFNLWATRETPLYI